MMSLIEVIFPLNFFNTRPRAQIPIALEFDSGFVDSAQVFYLPEDTAQLLHKC